MLRLCLREEGSKVMGRFVGMVVMGKVLGMGFGC